MKLEDKVALVTGSSQGIGAAIAIRLASEGAKIIINYHSDLKEAEEVLDKVEAAGSQGHIVKADASKIEEIHNLVRESLDRFGKVVRPMPGFGLYCGSKAAVELMGKVLSMELGDRGITVNTVSPGPTETEMFANSGDDTKAAAARSPFNRLGKPEDIADVVAFVVSEKCRWITGHTFMAGGGYV